MRIWKASLYFSLAAIPAFLAGAEKVTNSKALGILALNALYQGLIALKALQSDPKTN